jgi:hypothetical protein
VSQLRTLATRLVACELSGNTAADTNSPPAFRVMQKLRVRLSALMGNAGLRGLLSRSLALAGEEILWLRAVHVKSDGSLTGLQELSVEVGSEQFLEGAVELLTHLLGLLMAFIGERLTLLLISEIWPSVGHLDADEGE